MPKCPPKNADDPLGFMFDPTINAARERQKEDIRLNKYRITKVKFVEMLAAQDNQCAVCGIEASATKKRMLFVDHCHRTGVVRGLLCNECLGTVRKFKDNATRFERAAAYLRNAQTRTDPLPDRQKRSDPPKVSPAVLAQWEAELLTSEASEASEASEVYAASVLED